MHSSASSSSPSAPGFGAPIKVCVQLEGLMEKARLRAQAALTSGLPDEDDLPVDSDTQPPTEGVGKIAKTRVQGTGGGPAKSRDKARSKLRRQATREAPEKRELVQSALERHTKFAALKHRRTAKVMTVSFSITDMGVPSKRPAAKGPVASTGFVGRRLPKVAGDSQALSKADAIKLGFQYVEWDGLEPVPLLDKSSRVFAVLAGSPRDIEGWAKVNAEAQAAFDRARSAYKLDHKQLNHRRGSFPAIATGISYGGGQKRVSNLSHSRHNHNVLAELLDNQAVRRIAGFGDAAFKLYAPRLHDYYSATMKTLLRDNIALKANFRKSVFGCATFNLGPQVATHVHTDHLNLPAGWCAITAIGRFDPREGGHLLLWDLNLMIEFPPGALILIPSAILRHSNTVVQDFEQRCSFTQYSAGGLFRWVECGGKSQKDFSADGGVHALSGEQRWLRGVDIWSTADELQNTV